MQISNGNDNNEHKQYGILHENKCYCCNMVGKKEDLNKTNYRKKAVPDEKTGRGVLILRSSCPAW